MEYVPDASSFIVLDDCDLLQKLSLIPGTVVVLPEVSVEVKSDQFHALVDSGALHAERNVPSEPLPSQLTLGLHDGEMAVLRYCRGFASRLAIIDDGAAREVAELVHARYIGTAKLIIHMADVGLLARAEAEAIVRSLPARDFYIEPNVIEKVLRSPPLE